jgi:hypothetical protein
MPIEVYAMRSGSAAAADAINNAASSAAMKLVPRCFTPHPENNRASR